MLIPGGGLGLEPRCFHQATPDAPMTPDFPHPEGGQELKNADQRDRQIEALRNRLSRLCRACLRINESLDLDTVLQGVLDSARSLTDAQYALITTFDDAGKMEDFLVSGLPPEEARQLWEVPGGAQIFEYLSTVPGPLRVADFPGYTRSMGLPEFRPPAPVSAFLAAPMRPRGVGVGNIFVAKREPGQEFSPEDEETLVMFASQVALVIANARRHRDEQRARADLETLINTSPVGVAVFDAQTGVAVSINQESRRILGDLRTPEGSEEQRLEELIFRRADGREISQAEFPLARALSTGETVRAEEIVIQAPDGRSVTTLVNATPICSEDGEVESVVVTLQDMTPLEDLDRPRAEVLAMMSHELQVPLAAIKGSTTTVLGDPADQGTAEMIPFFRIIDQQADHMRGLIRDLLDVARIKTGTLQIDPEPAAVADLVDEARNSFLGRGSRHSLQIEVAPDLPPVMADRRRIVQVLGNLLGNAARYSPELSLIRITAEQQEVRLVISVADQGQGVSAERLPHLFRKFPRLEDRDADHRSGESGMGLAICKGIMEAHGGRIWAESDGIDQGTRFSFALPLAEEAGEVPRLEPSRSSGGPQAGWEPWRILVIDDDPHTLRTVRNALRKSGHRPILTGDPGEVHRLMKKHDPHLVLLDLVLPGVDGIELMQNLSEGADVPVIFLSAYGQDEVVARALDAGAADYMVKPFSPTELAARIRAVMRKRAATIPPEPTEPLVMGKLTIDYARHKVTVAGRPVRLTNIEYLLLRELSLHAGQVLTYKHLLRRVWASGRTSDLRPLRAVVKNLRRKLGDDAHHPTYIFNEPRVGYRMVE